MKGWEKAASVVAAIAIIATINVKGTQAGGQLGLGLVILAAAGWMLTSGPKGGDRGRAGRGRGGRGKTGRSSGGRSGQHPAREVGAMLRTLVASVWRAANPDHAEPGGDKQRQAAAAEAHKKAKRRGNNAASGYRPVKVSTKEMLREALTGIGDLVRPSRWVLRPGQSSKQTKDQPGGQSGEHPGTRETGDHSGTADGAEAGLPKTDNNPPGGSTDPAEAKPATGAPAADSGPSDPTADPGAPAAGSTPHQEDPDMTNAPFTSLWEAGESLGKDMPSLYDVRAFVNSIGRGTAVTAAFYQQLQGRMAGPMNIDPIVTDPIGRCAENQLVIADNIRTSAIGLDTIMTGTMEKLLDEGIRVPNHSQLQKDKRAAGIVPRFFQLVGGLDRHPFADVRVVLCMVKALRDASEGQALLYNRTRNYLIDKGYDMRLVERWTIAIKCQMNITTLLTDADAQFTMLLTMTIERLIDSGYMAPNAHLVDA